MSCLLLSTLLEVGVRLTQDRGVMVTLDINMLESQKTSSLSGLAFPMPEWHMAIY